MDIGHDCFLNSSKLDKKVEEGNKRRLEGHMEQPNEEGNLLEILHDGLNPVLPQLPEPIQTCLRQRKGKSNCRNHLKRQPQQTARSKDINQFVG